MIPLVRGLWVWFSSVLKIKIRPIAMAITTKKIIDEKSEKYP